MLIFVGILCPGVSVRVFSPVSSLFLSFSSLAAPSFLLLFSGQEVAQGYNILSDPIIFTVEED